MDEERARVVAMQTLGEFERLLAAKDIMIPSPDREGAPGEARLCGREKSTLNEAIVGLVVEHAAVPATGEDVGDASHPLRQLAIAILDEFEELLAAKDIMISSEDREGREEEACLYGTEYYDLEDAVVGILVEETEQLGSGRPRGPDRVARQACEAMRKRMAEAPVGYARRALPGRTLLRTGSVDPPTTYILPFEYSSSIIAPTPAFHTSRFDYFDSIGPLRTR